MYTEVYYRARILIGYAHALSSGVSHVSIVALGTQCMTVIQSILCISLSAASANCQWGNLCVWTFCEAMKYNDIFR